jgi:hypothetical protein
MEIQMMKRVAVVASLVLVLALSAANLQAASTGSGLTAQEMAMEVGCACGTTYYPGATCNHVPLTCVQLWVNVGPVPVPVGCGSPPAWDSGCNSESSPQASGTGNSKIVPTTCLGGYSIGTCSGILFCTADNPLPQNTNIPCGSKNVAAGC